MRPIDADALMDMVDETIDGVGNTCVLMNAKDFVRNFINNQQTIDAVPVVRCKDCKYWGMHKSLNVPWCFKMHTDKSEDGYCDSGEMRRDETD